MIEEFYEEVLGEYWPPERRFLERQYRNIIGKFKFENIPVKNSYQIEREFSLEDL